MVKRINGYGIFDESEFGAYESAKISNGSVEARVCVAVFENPFYCGTRFDWSGAIFSLKYKGREFFGKWLPSPHISSNHDCISGPVDEFSQIGYDDAQIGGIFLKIGAGALFRDAEPYNFRKTYKIADAGIRKISLSANSAEFVHELDCGKFSYAYAKRITLAENSPRMTIEHILKNRSSEPIETLVYNHNFFTLDKKRTSNGVSVSVPFELRGEIVAGIPEFAQIDAKTIRIAREIPDEKFALVKNMESPKTAQSYDITVRRESDGLFGARITSDKPLEKLTFWTCPTAVCPEPFTKISVPAGGEFGWNLHYDFFAL